MQRQVSSNSFFSFRRFHIFLIAACFSFSQIIVNCYMTYINTSAFLCCISWLIFLFCIWFSPLFFSLSPLFWMVAKISVDQLAVDFHLAFASTLLPISHFITDVLPHPSQFIQHLIKVKLVPFQWFFRNLLKTSAFSPNSHFVLWRNMT